jgi:hypothetical protein
MIVLLKYNAGNIRPVRNAPAGLLMIKYFHAS